MSDLDFIARLETELIGAAERLEHGPARRPIRLPRIAPALRTAAGGAAALAAVAAAVAVLAVMLVASDRGQQASPAERIAGTYTKLGDSGDTLRLDDGRFAVTTGSGTLTGSLETESGRIVLGNAGVCAGSGPPAIYRWALNGSQLMLVRERDGCAARTAALSSSQWFRQTDPSSVPAELGGAWRTPREANLTTGILDTSNIDPGLEGADVKFFSKAAPRCLALGVRSSACYAFDNPRLGALEWGALAVDGNLLRMKALQRSYCDGACGGLSTDSDRTAGVYRWHVANGRLMLTKVRDDAVDRVGVLTAAPLSQTEPVGGLPADLRGVWKVPGQASVSGGQDLDLRLYPKGTPRCAQLGAPNSGCYAIDRAIGEPVEWGTLQATGERLVFTSRVSDLCDETCHNGDPNGAGHVGVYEWRVEHGALRLDAFLEELTERAHLIGDGPLSQVAARPGAVPRELSAKAWRLPLELLVSGRRHAATLHVYARGAARCRQLGADGACYAIDAGGRAVEWGGVTVEGDRLTLAADAITYCVVGDLCPSRSQRSHEAGVYRWQITDGRLVLTKIADNLEGRPEALTDGALR